MKSKFETLYENVTAGDFDEVDADLDSLGIEGDEDLGSDEEGGEVTVTLSAEQADVLRSVLAQLDGGEEDEFEAEAEADDEFGSEGGDIFDEDAEEGKNLTAVSDSTGQKLTKGDKAGGTVKRTAKNANAALSTKGNETKGHPLAGEVKPLPMDVGAVKRGQTIGQ